VTSGPVQNFLQAGLWLVYAFLPEMDGFRCFLLIFSFYFPIDITPLDSFDLPARRRTENGIPRGCRDGSYYSIPPKEWQSPGN
ncbi:hypothetical protein MSS88_08775, partial [bacterium]|nr:hypothetical protein [bacterium]